MARNTEVLWHNILLCIINPSSHMMMLSTQTTDVTRSGWFQAQPYIITPEKGTIPSRFPPNDQTQLLVFPRSHNETSIWKLIPVNRFL
jgi:hypothetical protein